MAYPTYREPPGDPPPPIYDTAPVLSALVPNTVALGSPNFELHVLGERFLDGAAILWDGKPEPTTFVSPTELTTAVNMATAQVAVAIPVAVSTYAGTSAPLPFTFTEIG